jgi:hypothetical protein
VPRHPFCTVVPLRVAAALVLVVSVCLVQPGSAQQSGVYELVIVKSGDTYALDGKPDPLPYELDDFTRHIVWRFTNKSGVPLAISLESFACDHVPVSECPLDLTPGGTIECSSGALKLDVGQIGEILGAENGDASCSTGFFSSTHLWEYAIQIVAEGRIHRPDPQLQMDREFPFARVIVPSICMLLLAALIWAWLRSRRATGAR